MVHSDKVSKRLDDQTTNARKAKCRTVLPVGATISVVKPKPTKRAARRTAAAEENESEEGKKKVESNWTQCAMMRSF